MQISQILKRYKKPVLIALPILILVPIVLMLASYLIINPYKKYVVTPAAARPMQTGIVLGGGVTADGKPYAELRARLNSAADALEAGIIKKLIVSGDNRFEHYDEPTAMMHYLIEERGISSEKLIADYAGRSTYESCERAAKIFGVKEVTLFSAGSHLPRAIYLCRHFGIEAYGIANGTEANNSTRRELLARVKAILNTHIKGEPTLLGEPIPLE